MVHILIYTREHSRILKPYYSCVLAVFLLFLNLIQGLYIARPPNIQKNPKLKDKVAHQAKCITKNSIWTFQNHYMCSNNYLLFSRSLLLQWWASRKASCMHPMPCSRLPVCIFLPCSKHSSCTPLLILCCQLHHHGTSKTLLHCFLEAPTINALNPLASHHCSQHGVPWLKSLNHHLYTWVIWLLHQHDLLTRSLYIHNFYQLDYFTLMWNLSHLNIVQCQFLARFFCSHMGR